MAFTDSAIPPSFARGSSNGRTAAFEAVNLGSIPSPRTTTRPELAPRLCFERKSPHRRITYDSAIFFLQHGAMHPILDVLY